ncbi:kinesin-like protein KIFC3 isoform X4 [Argopecten irradians]|uniref:kinesin-like protein KIFC3 isoform X4 n=1 Tax=Argopecten irradians TaxID=31199 RepID=UPI00371279FE
MGNGASSDAPTTVQVKAAPESARSAPSSDQASSSKSPSHSKNTKGQPKHRSTRSEASTPRKGKFEEVEIRKNGAPSRPPQRSQGHSGASSVAAKQGKTNSTPGGQTLENASLSRKTKRPPPQPAKPPPTYDQASSENTAPSSSEVTQLSRKTKRQVPPPQPANPPPSYDQLASENTTPSSSEVAQLSRKTKRQVPPPKPANTPTNDQASSENHGPSSSEVAQLSRKTKKQALPPQPATPPSTNDQSASENTAPSSSKVVQESGQQQVPDGSSASQPTKPDPPKYPQGQDDIVFETFYHRSGKEIQCMYLGNTRYYLDDWGSKEWQAFPKRWYNEGLLITNNVLKDDQAVAQATMAAQQSRGAAAGAGAGASGSGEATQQGASRSRRSGDDREGVLKHPTKGRIPTYIYQRKHNVHFFFDPDQGQWMRMPIGWELHHEMVGRLVNQVEEMLPAWGDRGDILALLRQCNYDIDECISTYLTLQGDPWLKVAKTSKEVKGGEEKDEKIAELEKRVKELENQLSKESKDRQEAEKIIKDQQEKLTDLEVNYKQAEAQLSSMASTRPKSSMRPKTPQVVTTVVKEDTVNPDDIEELNDTAKTVRKAHAQLKMEVQRNFESLGGMMAQALKHVKMLKSSGQGQVEELEEVRALYRKEAMQRRLLYNQLQELRGNIRVFCRARKDDRVDNCLKFPSDQDIVAIHPQQGKKMFTFDRVFGIDTTQEQVFADTKPIITSCVDGYNVCLMAYGQTGSGKTFTMMGPENNPGINNRAIKELFQVCQDRKETQTYTMLVGLIEIYNETVVDLLSDDAKVIDLKTVGNKVNLPGLIEIQIKTPDDIKSVMKKGDKNRSVASTKMNSTSSRSHLLLLLRVEGQDKVTGSMTKGTLTLCDLAGSERISKTEAEGQRLVEAAAINKSLSALGQVFQALRTSQLHIPYRNSKLTQILQPSLGGDAKACLFVNVSPDVNNSSETVSTLTFGANAKQVALGQAKQNIKKGGPLS